MMHSNNFVLAIKDQCKHVLREIAGKVYLPFNSEYSLLLKNNNSVRACCSVSIDGTDVLGGDELILNSNFSLDLERFLVDGDMQRGNRFKFVPLSDGRVSDPSSPENGLIEVRFWKEIQKPTYWYGTNTYPYQEKYWPKNPYNPPIFMASNGTSGWSGGSQSIMSCSFSSAGAPGATVEGSISTQGFTRGSFEGKDGEATIIRLQLMGRDCPITVEKTKHVYCGKCGKSNPYNNKFCGRCGSFLD